MGKTNFPTGIIIKLLKINLVRNLSIKKWKKMEDPGRSKQRRLILITQRIKVIVERHKRPIKVESHFRNTRH